MNKLHIPLNIKLILFLSLALCIQSTHAAQTKLAENAVNLSRPNPLLPPVSTNNVKKETLSSSSTLYVREVRLEGSTILTPEVVANVTNPFIGRQVSAEELQALKDLLTHLYVDQGYVTSGVLLPDQEIQEGIVRFKAVESVLSGVEITDNKWLRSGYLEPRLRLAEGLNGKPFHLARFQEQLKLLERNPLIERIHAEVAPGAQKGEAYLKFSVEEARPYGLGFTINNHRSPSIGSLQTIVHAEHLNLTGWGDAVRGHYGISEGADNYGLSYAVPLNRYDTTLNLGYDKSSTLVVTAPFSALDIESRAESWSLGIQHPLINRPVRQISFALELSTSKSRTYMGGTPFAFTEGTDEGRSMVSLLNFNQEWVERSQGNVLAGRSSFEFGTHFFGATHNQGRVPDGQFQAWHGQFQWNKSLNWLESHLLTRLDTRFARQHLLSVNAFAMGGVHTVRGYRENQLTRDNGIVASLEWQVPVGHIKIPHISRPSDDGQIQLAPFIDYGNGWNTDVDTPSPWDISSIGIASRWSVSNKISTELIIAHGLRKFTMATEHDLQDEGVHFNLSMDLF